MLMLNINREWILTSLEQWDIYKLDPAYKCTVSTPYSKIIRREPSAHSSGALPSTSSQDSLSKTSKRHRHSSPAEQGPTPKRARRTPEVIQLLSDSDEEEEDEVQEMIVDPTSPKRRLVPKNTPNVPPRRTTRDRRHDHLHKPEYKAQRQQAAPLSRNSSMSQSMPSTPSMSSQSLPMFGSPTKRKGMK